MMFPSEEVDTYLGTYSLSYKNMVLNHPTLRQTLGVKQNERLSANKKAAVYLNTAPPPVA